MNRLVHLGWFLPGHNTDARCTSGDDFRSLVEPYVTSGLTRGIPSLFADVKSLYVDEEKAKTIGSIAEAVTKRLSETAPASGTTGREN